MRIITLTAALVLPLAFACTPDPVDPTEICDDRADNDGDDAVDCADEDCASSSDCSLAAEGEGEGAIVAEGEGEGAIAAEGEGEGVVVAEGEGEGAVVDPPRHEASCTDGDDDDDGLADCADPDCAEDPACVSPPPSTCAAPPAGLTLQAMEARYATDIDPLMRRSNSGCFRCHAGDSIREMKMDVDVATTFTTLHAQGFFALANPDGIPTRVLSDNMPKAQPAWTQTEKDVLTTFACDLASLDPVPAEGEGEGAPLPAEGEGEGAPPVDPTDVGDETSPQSVTLPASLTTDIAANGDVDCYSFSLAAPATLLATPGQPGGGACDIGFDTVVTLFEGKNPVAIGDDNGNDLCGPLSVDLGVGGYTVCVEEFDNVFALAGVTLAIATTPIANVVDDDGNAVTPVASTLPLARTSTIAPSLDSDCVRVSAPAGRTFFTTSDGAGACPVDGNGDAGDTLLEVFADGTSIARNDDGGPGLCSYVAVDLAAAADIVVCTSTRTATTPVDTTPGVVTTGRSGRAGLVISALDYDTPSTDTDEAAVITNTASTAASLTGIFFVSVNGADGAAIKKIDLGATLATLDPGESIVIAQNPASFTGAPAAAIINAGAASFLQNAGNAGDGAMLVDASGTTASIVDSIAWGGACAASNIRVGALTISGNLVEGTATTLVDSNLSGAGLCRLSDDGNANVPFAFAQDSNDAAADLAACSF